MYHQICELEVHHGVCLGTSYVNETVGKEMIHYIDESRRQELKQKLAQAKFFSLLLVGLRIDNKEAELSTTSLLTCRYSLITSTASLHLSHIHPFLPPTFDLGASCHT